MSNYVPGRGPYNAKLMIVGEAPGKVEDEQMEPFVGPSGNLVNEMLSTGGIERPEVYVTNVVKHRPPENDLSKLHLIGKKLEDYYPQLWEEVMAIKPNCILALGDVALTALTGKRGIKKWRGSIIPSGRTGTKLVSTYHPANLLHDKEEQGVPFKYSAKYYMQLDFNRAIAQSKFPEYQPPRRTLEIARNSAQLWRFLDTYKDRHTVSVDIEVIKAIPVCVALAFNSHHAISVPLVDVYRIQKREPIPEHEIARMWVMLAEFFARPDIRVIGQNIKFDEDKLLRPCGMKMKIWLDTAILMHTLYPEFPKALAFMTSIFTEEPYYKDEGKEFNWRRDDFAEFQIYNCKDACVTYEIAGELLKEFKDLVVPGFPNWKDDFFFGFMMKLHGMYQRIENEGIAIDFDRQKELVKQYKAKIKETQDKLNKLAGFELNVNAWRQVHALLYKEWRLPFRSGRGKKKSEAGTGKDILTALAANTAKKPEHKECILTIILQRGQKKSLGTYFMAKTDFDKRMRTVYNITGTETGRSSTSLQDPPVRPYPMGITFHNMTKHGDVGSELREMFVPDPGHWFLEADLSQAEARLVALLGQSEETLELFNKTDIHKLTASWIFGTDPKYITKEQRFIGKTTRHAGNYDMGKHRLMMNTNDNARKFGINVNISEWKAGQILDKFHQMSPWIRGTYHPAIQEALLGQNSVLVNPFGRRREFMDRWGDNLFREAYAYIPQSTVIDHLRMAIFRIWERIPWLRVCLEAHDALLAIVPIERFAEAAAIVKEEMEKPIDFSRCTLSRHEIIIPAEVKVGRENYRKLDEYEFAKAA